MLQSCSNPYAKGSDTATTKMLTSFMRECTELYNGHIMADYDACPSKLSKQLQSVSLWTSTQGNAGPYVSFAAEVSYNQADLIAQSLHSVSSWPLFLEMI